MTGRLILRTLLRSPLTTLVRVGVLALAVALLGSMLVFVSHSLSTMTGNAVHAVPLALQAPVSSRAAAESVAARVAREDGIRTSYPAATAPFAGAEHTSAQGVVRTGAGAILAVPPDYTRRVPVLRFLRGGLADDAVVLDQQLAATLQAEVGDVVRITPRAGKAPVSLRVSGVVLVTQPDVIFHPLDPQVGPAPAQPPAEIAVMSLDTFSRRIAPALTSLAAAGIGASAVPGAQNGIQWQVDANVDPSRFHGDPSSALRQAQQLQNRLERDLLGRARFVNNLTDSLTSAAGDALYAEALYVMLAIPGALIGLGIAYLAALGTAEADRRTLALLRSRGATRRRLVGMALTESVLLGAVAGLVGFFLALASVPLLTTASVSLSAAGYLGVAAACVSVAILGAAAARLAANAGVLRGPLVEQRRARGARPGTPLWQRLYVDLAALVISALVYWLTRRTGFSAVVNPDSNPTLSLSLYMFLAPALLWLGAALLLLRLRGRVVVWLVHRRGAGVPRRSAAFLLASAGRRGTTINRGLLLVGLLLAFAVQLGVFTATYDQQARIDAQLTLGADVAVTTPPGAGVQVAAQARRTGGVAAVSAVDHAYAYVGPDLQDTYGVDPSSLPRATTLRSSYFLGSGASTAMGRLAAHPDGLLVSKETISDYSLALGDLVNLRVLDQRSHAFVVAPFHVAGIVQEFPSAPKDSFMVANRSYLDSITHGGANLVLVRAHGDPAAVGRRVAASVSGTGSSVKTIAEQARETTSSITTVDLTGISRIEQAFAVILATATLFLLTAVTMNERRREFAVMSALGTSTRGIAAYVLSEAAIILVAAIGLGLGLGLLLAEMLTTMLTHVFDPPPDQLAIPWLYLAALLGSALLAGALAVAAAAARLGRLPLATILREGGA